ncbi:hypothetical protein [Bacillus massiliigorillae]|uniref:hypothetical protein n=1 Tax=Bacillus massiliigorillae TaxID=1243664 RepID=UPI00039CEE0D|nr:hypothetical protein [Bacillus massiliigorillae]
MFVVICKDNNSVPTISMFDDEIDALDNIKYLAEKGAMNIYLTTEVPFEIERKVNVKLI